MFGATILKNLLNISRRAQIVIRADELRTEVYQKSISKRHVIKCRVCQQWQARRACPR